MIKQWIKNHQILSIVIGILVIGFLVYVNILPNEMFWDDNDFILNNEFIKDWQHFPKLFSENTIAGAGLSSDYWRPVLSSFFSVEWHLWQDWAPGYHFMSIVFHLANSILLFFILLYLFKKKNIAGLTALIFAIHPLQTEAVSYAAGLGDPLHVFFMFLGIVLFMHAKDNNKSIFSSPAFWGSILAYALALMSKEIAIIMPGLIFLVDIFYKEKGKIIGRLKKSFVKILPFIAFAGLYIFLRATVFNFGNTFNLYKETNIFTESIAVRFFTFLKILTIYLSLIFVPVGLHMERSVSIENSLFSFQVLLGLLIFVILVYFALRQIKKRPIVTFGILWFFVAIIPMSNIIIPINGLLYEHWLYVPLIGIVISFLSLAFEIVKKLNIKRIGTAVLVIFLIFLSVKTILRNADWRDPITFYKKTLIYAPDSYRIINNLGMSYADKRIYEEAEKTYKKAIELEPEMAVAYHNLGNLYINTNNHKRAEEYFKKAIEKDNDFIFSYYQLYNLYIKEGEEEKALEILNYYPRK